MTYDEFKIYNNQLKRQGFTRKHIDSINTNDTCLLDGKVYAIPQLISDVMHGNYCISNSSKLQKYKFSSLPSKVEPLVTKETVLEWYNYYSGNGKATIGRIFREYFGDDVSYESMELFRSKGFDSLVVKNIECGIKTKVVLPYEVVVFDENTIAILPNNAKPPYIYHYTKGNFTKFDRAFIGSMNGSSLGGGFYFTPIALEEYGNPMKVRLTLRHSYHIENINNVVEIFNYVNTVITPNFRGE